MRFLMKNYLLLENYQMLKRRRMLFAKAFASMLLLLCVCGDLAAQKVTVNADKESILVVINSIKKQSGYSFFYNSSLIKQAEPVTVHVDNVDVKDALSAVFKNQPFSYSIVNKTVVITPAKGNADKSQISEGRKRLSGTLLDSFSNPLPDAEIVNLKTKERTYSSLDGYFHIMAEQGDSILIRGVNIEPQRISYNGSSDFNLVVGRKAVMLANVEIETSVAKKNPTNFIDVELSNRSYMNLGQILQGTIPGVSLQIASQTASTVTGVNITGRDQNTTGSSRIFKTVTVDQFLQLYPSNGQAIIDALSSGSRPSWIPVDVVDVVKSTSVRSTLVPQLRGENNFSNGTTGMLVVIDGFARDEFPADYPMSNVESIRVIKDPRELQKWGPKGANGVILVTTKQSKGRKVSVNFSSNIYYQKAPKFDRAKMRLATSGQFLDYMKDAYDSSFFGNMENQGRIWYFGARPAMRLLSKLYTDSISQNQFNNSWDSLKGLSNESQLNMMYQDVVNSNHTLSLMGGDQIYQYVITGTYNVSNGNNLRNYNHTYSLNANNQFNLLKDRLHIDWYLNYIYSKARSGSSFSAMDNSLDPYQMLVDKDGKYIYDYTSLNPEANKLIMSYGYKNFGQNILEDARVNNNLIGKNTVMSRLNWNWKLTNGLMWSTSVYYNRENKNTENIYGEASSYARQTVDQYGALVGNSIDYYAPPGDIMSKSTTKQYDINVRTALTYFKSIGLHDIGITVGGGGYRYQSITPAYVMVYGYNSRTKKGSTVFLPTGNTSQNLYNFYSLFPSSSSNFYPYNLTYNTSGGDTIYSKTLNWNISTNYSYNKRLDISLNVNSALSPNYGQTPSYATMTLYSGNLSYHLLDKAKDSGFFNDIVISGGASGTKMPNLTGIYSNIRYMQNYWNNYGIWINGASPTQQNGQNSKTVFEGISASFWQKQLKLKVAFNTQKRSGIAVTRGTTMTYDSSSSVNYMSGGLEGKFRKGLLSFNVNYDKSPEGQSQVNGYASYDIARESYFHSDFITSLSTDARLESISALQGMGIMMGTNTTQSGNFSLATNGTYNQLPPKNTYFDVHARLGILQDRYILDLRYYNRKTSGLNNNVPIPTDPSTGLSTMVTYSELTNKGVEFFLSTTVVKSKKVNYSITLNGAYNINVATSVPVTDFTLTSGYTTAYRNGYNINNLWSYRWAGLDHSGNAQIYANNGTIVANPDSATLQKSLVYSGTTNAPWNGGFIQDVTVGSLFARVALTFSLGGIMRYYIPAPSGGTLSYSSMVDERWRKPGDELKTDVPALVGSGVDYATRAFITQNSTNSVLSADFVRLQEIMAGWNANQKVLKKLGMKSLSFVLHAQNLAVWTRNRFHIDPSIMASNGMISMPISKIYSCSINIGF